MAAENSGGRVNYYLVEVKHPQREDQPAYQAECEDLIEAMELNFDEANIFKEIWRTARARQGTKKEGNSELRAAQKIVHYGKRILRRVMRITTTKETTPNDRNHWFEWDGDFGMPPNVDATTEVEVITKEQKSMINEAGNFLWEHFDNRDNIVRYRIL